MVEQTPERFGRYQVRRLVGRGAMGVVYEGWDPLIARRVAIKVIRIPPWMTEEDLAVYRARFFNEARAAGSLQHPSIVMIYDMGTDEKTRTPFLVMEYVDGVNLKKRISEEGPLPISDVLHIGTDVAEGLAYAHRQGIVHRDIKSANILLTEERAKITDFGIAHLPHSELTRTGQVIGSPSYMAPEVLHGRGARPSSDLFSLGVVLYEALTGERPFPGKSVTEITTRILTADPLPLEDRRPDVPSELRQLVYRLLEKDPADRFQHADEVVRRLRALTQAAAGSLQAIAESDLTLPDEPTLPLNDFPSVPAESARAPSRGTWQSLSRWAQWRSPYIFLIGSILLVGLSFLLVTFSKRPNTPVVHPPGPSPVSPKSPENVASRRVTGSPCPFRLTVHFPYARMKVLVPGKEKPIIDRVVYPWKKSVFGPIKKIVREVTLVGELPPHFAPRLILSANAYEHEVQPPVECENGETVRIRVDIPSPGAKPLVRVIGGGGKKAIRQTASVHPSQAASCRLKLILAFPDQSATLEIAGEDRVYFEKTLHARKKKLAGVITRWTKEAQITTEIPANEKTLWFTLKTGAYQRRVHTTFHCNPDEEITGRLIWKKVGEEAVLEWTAR